MYSVQQDVVTAHIDSEDTKCQARPGTCIQRTLLSPDGVLKHSVLSQH